MIPRVSIGVPVWNGASLLAETLEDLAAQSFPDFEVIISENASTDATAGIAEAFARRDRRFRLIRQAENIGALRNYRACLAEARAPFFLWRAYDDLSNRGYLGALTAALEASPAAVLAVPRSGTVRIGSPRKRIQSVAGFGGRSSVPTLLRRSRAGWFYGLMRRDYAEETLDAVLAEYPAVWAWDHLMLFPAILSRRVVFADDAVFFHRLNAYSPKEARPRSRSAALDLFRAYWSFCRARLDASDLPLAERWAVKLALLRHIDRRVLPLRRLLTG